MNKLTSVIFAVVLSLIAVTGCDFGGVHIQPEGDSLLGKTIYLNGDKCSYTSEGNRVDITCEPIPEEEDSLNYLAVIKDIDDVYDADTIQEVLILLHRFDDPKRENLALWPEIEKHTDGIYTRTNLRIQGVDAPEFKRESKTVVKSRLESQGIPEDDLEKEVTAAIERHKARGVAARDFLRDLISRSTIEGRERSIEINIFDTNGELYGEDKYGRSLVDVFVFIDGKKINVATALIEACHAVVYDGGTKTFDWSVETTDCEAKTETSDQ